MYNFNFYDAFDALDRIALEESAKTDFKDKFGDNLFNSFEKAKDRLKNNGQSVDYQTYLKMSSEELTNFLVSLCDTKKLVEDIESMKKFYPNISDEKFMGLIRLDPTYRGGNTAGTYAKWILGLANQNKLTNIGHVTDALRRFEQNKNQLINKDILKYKSLAELDAALNDDNSYKDLSHRQEVRGRQKDRKNADLSSDADLIYEDNDWRVWVPKTYAASCKLGQGTSWCTASTGSSNDYNGYSSKGKLYININKHNTKEKYQFHFESKSFMDADDKPIDVIEFLSEYPKLQQFYQKIRPEETKNDLVIENNVLVKYKAGLFAEKQTEVVIPESVTSIGELAFYNCSSLDGIAIPESVTSIGDGAFYGCSSLPSITIPEGVTSIGDDAFSGCRNLTSITIPEGVTSIGDRAFYGCSSLPSITIPEGVKSIGYDAFSGCRNLTSITIPEGVTSIGDGAFYGCRNLTSIIIPISVTSIGYDAFGDCRNLTSITIPEGVTSIDYAFRGCNSLETIYYSGNISNFRSWYNKVSDNLPKVDILDSNTGEVYYSAKEDKVLV